MNSSFDPQSVCRPTSRRPPLRVNNVAIRINRKERMVRYLIATKQIRAFKIDGKSWGCHLSDVEQYLRLREARDANR
jgi:hypothetical protein